MSADDFQTKYSFVLENTLKSAVAETTKLFETMLDELKAEISNLKKENVDLRSKYSQLENWKTELYTRASEKPPEKSQRSEKRDAAIQCDIVPLRTILVAQCQPLTDSSPQNPNEQWLYKDREFNLQEHNYVSRRKADSQRTHKHIKKQQNDCSLQQVYIEENELTLNCGNVVSNNGSLPTSACETGNEYVDKNFLNEHIPLPLSNDKTSVALELPSLKMAHDPQLQDSISEPQQSLVISLAAVKDSLEESEMSPDISIIGAYTELSTSAHHQCSDQHLIENDQTLLLRQRCQREDERSANKKNVVVQLAESASNYADMDKEALKTKEGKKSSHQPEHCESERPPKRVKHLQQAEMETIPLVRGGEVQVFSALNTKDTTVPKSSKASKVKSKKALFINTPGSAQERDITASKENTQNLEVCSSRKRCSATEKSSASEQFSKEMLEANVKAPPKKNVNATETNVLQAPPLNPTQCPTSVTIKDAMLLIEAMNQSTVDNGSSLQTRAAAPQPKCGLLVGKCQNIDKTAKSPNVGIPKLGTLLITDSPTAQKIFVVPRSASLLPHTIVALSSSQPSAVASTPVDTTAAQNTSLLPTSPAAKTSIETPFLSSVPQKTIFFTTGPLLPTVPSHALVTSTNQGKKAPQSKLQIINPTQLQFQSCVLTKKQDLAMPISNRQTQTKTNLPMLESPPSSFLSQDNKDFLKAKPTSSEVAKLISQKTIETPKNGDSPEETSNVSETANDFETCSGLHTPVRLEVSSVFSINQLRADPKFSAIVQLNRLPFSISNKESVSVSKLISDGFLKPLAMLKEGNRPTQSSWIPQISTDIRQSLKETSPVSEKPCHKASESICEDSQDNSYSQKFPSSSVSATANNMTEPSVERPLSNQDKEKDSNDVQHCSLPNYPLNAVTSSDASDPHLQMSKTQFLAQLAVSPIVEKPEKVSNNDLPDGTTCSKKSLNTTYDGHRLKHHLKSNLPMRRHVANPEPCVETDATNANLKKSLPLSPGSGPSPQNTNSNSVSPRRKKSSTSNQSPGNPKSTSASPSKTSATKEVSENTVSACVTPKRANTARDVGSPKITHFTSISAKSTSSTESPTSPENKNSTGVGSRKTNLTTDTRNPHKTKSSSSTPKMSKNMSESKSCSRRSTFPKVNPSKRLKRESKTDDNVPQSSILLGRDGVRSTRSTTTSAKKPRLSQDGSCSKNNLAVASVKKLAIAAKDKTVAKMNNCKQQELQNEAKTSQASGKQTHCEAVKKFTCKAVWIPPKMSIVKTPKKDTKSTDFNNYVHSIPVKASPIVSPLQPLLVIGGHLLKNQCGECGRILSSTAALESHVGLHTGRRPFSCTFCGKSFPDSKGLQRHGRVHRNGRIHVCPQCGKGFVYRFGLSKHLQMVHGRLKPFVCQECNKGFYTKRDVEAHIRIHTGEKPFHCNLCEKKFTRRVELNVHLRWHNGEKRHWCPYCEKGFLDFNNLKRHKYTHTGEKPHSCPHCPKRFTQSGHLKKHVKNVHKIE